MIKRFILILSILFISFAAAAQENSVQANASQTSQDMMEKLIQEQLKIIQDTKMKVELDKLKKEEEAQKTV